MHMRPRPSRAGFMIPLIMTIIVVVLLVTIIGFRGCMSEDAQKALKHRKSSLVGLDRVITLYAADGSVIFKQRGQFKVETLDGVISWIDDDGKEHKVTGTIHIEEQ